MASIFTYDPDPPRVASPWLRGGNQDAADSTTAKTETHLTSVMNDTAALSLREASERSQGVSRLEAEPQDGPVEYKLHLLLRPRRKFRSTSTGDHVAGSRHSKYANSEHAKVEQTIGSILSPGTATPPSALTQQTRQHRLEQLTTQLLWRLQQSSPYHTSSASNIILPSLPEALPELEAPQYPAKLLHGLEESRGALYEIGVSDDGTLVGLAEDEMEESLNNLRAMAACLGCTVEVLRREIVGECEWLEDVNVGRKERKIRCSGKLAVVEALVKPFLQSQNHAHPHHDLGPEDSLAGCNPIMESSTEQLRITLTGPTMSGKSTLLGTLTTSTLDNGRGKSRLSMLKHRHEINSGVTSSVTQELVGYQDALDGSVDIINYATENIASWTEMHVAASGSRLVFISDSAGHPRYRRTIVRGLVGWAPHWTLLCVPAEDTAYASEKPRTTLNAQQNGSSLVSDIDLCGAQLDLCLRLRLPLVVVITKLDIASRNGLKATLSRVLDALKAFGRKPAILANSHGEVSEEDLQAVDAAAIGGAYDVVLPLLNDLVDSVPIVLTSAVQGTGMTNLHALLHELPIPDSADDGAQNLELLFYIEDIYNKATEVDGLIVSGRLRSGHLTVGDSGTIGPFSTYDLDDSEDSDERPLRRASAQLPTSRSFPGALRHAHLAAPHFRMPNEEWRRFRVTSIRNLRHPVHSLLADQVGTVAIVPDEPHSRVPSGFGGIRKGMVLTAVQPQATRTFVAEFKREDLESLAIGNHVVVYIASVRASARVVSARAPDSPTVLRGDEQSHSNAHDYMNFNDMRRSGGDSDIGEVQEKVAGAITALNLLVTFTFDASKELIKIRDQVLVMPGGGPGLYGGHERGEKGVAGLEGFVGEVTEIFS